MSNNNLLIAKKINNDEFYTPYETVEYIVSLYKEEFFGKTVYCNCDDCYKSNFVKFFIINFNKLKLKKLIATCKTNNNGYGIIIKKTYPLFCNKNLSIKHILNYTLQNKRNILFQLKENGDFKSNECLNILTKCDIICTNPPFSLFKQFFNTIKNKKYLIIANALAPFYHEILKRLIKNKITMHKCSDDFITDTGIKPVKSCCISNLNTKKQHKDRFVFS